MSPCTKLVIHFQYWPMNDLSSPYCMVRLATISSLTSSPCARSRVM